MSKVDIDIRMTENELSRDNNDVNAVMEKLTELIELQKQTNVLLTQQTQNYADFCSTLEKMNHNSNASSSAIDILTRVVVVYTVLTLAISLMNIFVTISLDNNQSILASIFGFISSILVAYGLYYSIHMIKEANDETKKIQK